MRRGQPIGTGEIPQEPAVMAPGNELDAIWALPIPMEQTGWLYRATGVSASLKALAKILLITEGLEWRPALLRQDRPWNPSMETAEPTCHRHTYALKPMEHPYGTPPQGEVLHFRDASIIW